MIRGFSSCLDAFLPSSPHRLSLRPSLSAITLVPSLHHRSNLFEQFFIRLFLSDIIIIKYNYSLVFLCFELPISMPSVPVALRLLVSAKMNA
jgi:hypothetical protein